MIYRRIHEVGSGDVVSAVCYSIYYNNIYLSLCKQIAETTFWTLYVNSPVDGINNVLTYVHSCEKHTNMTAKQPANTALEYSTTVRFIITYRYTVYSVLNTGQSIPHSEPFLHLRCGNGSQTYIFESLYLHITSDLIELYINNK